MNLRCDLVKIRMHNSQIETDLHRRPHARIGRRTQHIPPRFRSHLERDGLVDHGPRSYQQCRSNYIQMREKITILYGFYINCIAFEQSTRQRDLTNSPLRYEAFLTFARPNNSYS